jgi:hypothetical protein
LRPNAADDAVGPHEADGRYRLEQVLRHQRIHGRNSGDVDDREGGLRLDNPLQERFHYELRAAAVQRSDHRDRQYALPKLDDGRGELQQFLLLAIDDVLASTLIGRHSPLRHFVNESGHFRHCLHEIALVVSNKFRERGEQRRLQLQYKSACLASGAALRGSGARQCFQHVLGITPGVAFKVRRRSAEHSLAKCRQEFASLSGGRCMPVIRWRDPNALQPGFDDDFPVVEEVDPNRILVSFRHAFLSGKLSWQYFTHALGNAQIPAIFLTAQINTQQANGRHSGGAQPSAGPIPSSSDAPLESRPFQNLRQASAVPREAQEKSKFSDLGFTALKCTGNTALFDRSAHGRVDTLAQGRAEAARAPDRQ